MKISNSLVKEGLAQGQSIEEKLNNEDITKWLRVKLKEKNSNGGEILIANLYWGSIMFKPMLFPPSLWNLWIQKVNWQEPNQNQKHDLLLCENLSKSNDF